MLNCFTVKKRNKTQSQEQLEGPSTESLWLDRQIIDAISTPDLWWTMGNHISEDMNGHHHAVASATSANGYPSPIQSNDNHSPQQSSATRADKVPVESTKTLDGQSTADHTYAVVAKGQPQCTTPGSCLCHSKSNDAPLPQKSTVTRPDKLATVSTFKSNDHHSPQQSSATRPVKVEVEATKSWTIADNGYIIVTKGQPQCTTPGNCPHHPKTNDALSTPQAAPQAPKVDKDSVGKDKLLESIRQDLTLKKTPQKSSVARADKPAVMSQKNRGNPTGGHNYVNMPATPEDNHLFRSQSKGIHSPQKSPIRFTEIFNNLTVLQETLAEELKKCSPSLQETQFVSKHQSPTLSSENGTQPLQKPNTGTEIDKKINRRIPIIQEINNEELQQILKKRKERIDTYDQHQEIAKSLPQQITAMDTNRPFGARSFNTSTYHDSRPKLAVTVAEK